MKTVFPTILLCLALAGAASGQDKSYFPQMTKVLVDTSFHAVFGYEKGVKVLNISCQTLDPKDPFYCDSEAVVSGMIVAKYKAPGIKDSLTILFDTGMSDDPEFSIYGKDQKLVGHVSCVEMYINASGLVYTAGHANNMFNRRRKFQIQKDTLLEIKQPYYYVGIKGPIQKDVTLYKNKTGPETVAQLPKGYEVEVLLAESSNKDYEADLLFLVRTDFGLVGWLRLENEDMFGGVLTELFFMGD
ncbi:MAG TPA: hypothetical protein PLO67_04795 [Saprospiraceae bacterium]|nr:hypothetical protein [Saprospiraceae bacterium]HPI07420.1 hypothetical protein [Saprospiraceae bacterium]